MQNQCDHQLIFQPALDHAATCARCGAIVLLASRQHDERAVRIEWVRAAQGELLDETVGSAIADD